MPKNWVQFAFQPHYWGQLEKGTTDMTTHREKLIN